MQTDPAHDASAPCAAFDALVPDSIADVAADRGERVVRLPDEPGWIAARRADLSLRVLELVRAEARMTAQLAPAALLKGIEPEACRDSDSDAETPPFAAPPIELPLGMLAGAELLLQRGTLWLNERELYAGTWLRVPSTSKPEDTLVLSRDVLLLITIGQQGLDDGQLREVDTTDPERWLDGPVEGIDVLPLHGQARANVMLVHWESTAAFRPNLDPAGDEVFVLSGVLHDANGSFAAGSWIRNPVPAWQSWAGTPGTRICYKSGHFSTVPDVKSIPTASEGC